MKHPYFNYTLDDALALARVIKYAPFPKIDDPTPPVSEAVEIVRESVMACKSNWISGMVALEVLRAANGENIQFTC